jgi:hypothetical protein
MLLENFQKLLSRCDGSNRHVASRGAITLRHSSAVSSIRFARTNSTSRSVIWASVMLMLVQLALLHVMLHVISDGRRGDAIALADDAIFDAVQYVLNNRLRLGVGADRAVSTHGGGIRYSAIFREFRACSDCVRVLLVVCDASKFRRGGAQKVAYFCLGCI